MSQLRRWALGLWIAVAVVLPLGVLGQNCPVENCDTNVLSCAYINKQFRCKLCAPGWTVYKSGLSCECPEGSFSATGGCAPCPSNYYCPLAQGQVACPVDLVTARLGAKSINDCVNPPGYRYVPRGGAGGLPGIAPCGDNYYSTGLGKQLTCTACPSGFQTRPDDPAGTHTSPDVCKAPPGYLMQGGGVVPCPEGSFREGYGEPLDTCTLCSNTRGVGSTTNTTGSTSVMDCTAVEPGYAALNKWGSVMWATTDDASMVGKVKLCPQNWYCPGGSVLTGGSGVPVPCPGSLKTVAEGARAVSECLAPPGFRIKPGTNDTESCFAGNDTTPGEYKTTWDRSTRCTPCGTGGWRSADRMVLFVAEPTTGNRIRAGLVKGLSTSCFLRKGMGALRSGMSGTRLELRAFPCPANFFGSSAAVYGQRVKPCLPCPAGQVTSLASAALRNSGDFPSPTDVGYFTRASCVHPVGYGWVTIRWTPTPGVTNSATVSQPCLLDSWSAGGHNNTCTACDPGTYTAAEGSSSAGACDAGNLGPGQRVVAVQPTASNDTPGIYQSLTAGANFSGLADSGGSWVSVASSATGLYQVAARSGSDQAQGKIYVSTNYGRSWVGAGEVFWSDLTSVACSSSGQYMAAVGTDNVYVSADYGSSWAALNKAGAWSHVAMDAGGSRIAAVQSGADGSIAIAARAGVGASATWLWSEQLSEPIASAGGGWSSVALSSNGSVVAAVQSGVSGRAFVALCNSFVPPTCSWQAVLNDTGSFSAVAMDADGGRLLVAQSGPSGGLWTGLASGGTWAWTQAVGNPRGDWSDAAVSRTFQTLVAVQRGAGGLVYSSRDSGGSWAAASSSGDWRGVALSQ